MKLDQIKLLKVGDIVVDKVSCLWLVNKVDFV